MPLASTLTRFARLLNSIQRFTHLLIKMFDGLTSRWMTFSCVCR